jgi:hypothetical protein
MAKKPVRIVVPEKIVKLASGYDFVLFLSETGQVYSCGNAEAGQLGRLNHYSAEDGRRGGLGKCSSSSVMFAFVDVLRTIDHTRTNSLQSIVYQREESRL